MPTPPDADPSPAVKAGSAHVLIVGGTPAQRGGLEAYCDRAAAALTRHAKGYTISLLPTDAAYVRLPGLGGIGRRLVELVRLRRRVDVAWVQVSNLAETLFVMVARALGMRVLATPHFGANSRMQTSAWARRLCCAMLGRAHAIGTLFEGQQDEIALPTGPARHVIGTFLPERAFADAGWHASPHGPLRLIHAARFSAAKGSLLMIDLCARLKQEGIAVEAVLLGRADPDMMATLDARIAAHGLAGDIALPGWLDENATQDALRHADVLVHLSTIDSFPLIVLEAQAAGTLPVVRPMAGGRHMVQTYGGHVADGEDPVASAAAWLKATPPEILRDQGRAAAAAVRAECDWPRVTMRVMAAVDSIRKA